MTQLQSEAACLRQEIENLRTQIDRTYHDPRPTAVLSRVDELAEIVGRLADALGKAADEMSPYPQSRYEELLDGPDNPFTEDDS